MQFNYLLKSYSDDIDSRSLNNVECNQSTKTVLPIKENQKKPKKCHRETGLYIEMASGSVPSDTSTQFSTNSNNAKAFKFTCGVSNLKRDDKEISEDSFFISDYAIGLADGVGGWSEYGINSSGFSSELMQSCYDISTHYVSSLDPISLLSLAYSTVKSYGSSTAVICVSDAGQLTICNLGDSGFMHIKFLCGKPFVVQKSQPQQHDFNIPYQLSNIPSDDYMQKLVEADSSYFPCLQKLKECTFCQDAPVAADYYQINNVCSGDLILLASDGVLDNLYDYEIIAVICKMYQKSSAINVKKLADGIAQMAYKKSKMTSDVSSPFNEKLESHSQIICDGGKEDDICVIAGLLC
jgi:protein phosphatase PTC7